MTKNIFFSILLFTTILIAADSIPSTDFDFLDDFGGYLIFGEKTETPSAFWHRQINKDDCARYADIELRVRAIKIKQFSLFLAGRQETFMAGTHDLFFSAPMFQDYYFSFCTEQNLKFIKPGLEFQHFCGHFIDTLPFGDSIESWERLRLNCQLETGWKKGVDYPAGDFNAEIGAAKYFPLTDCSWQYGFNYSLQLSIHLTKAIRPFASISNEIKIAPQLPKQSKAELRLGVIFKGKIVNLVLNGVMPLENDKSGGIEIKIFK